MTVTKRFRNPGPTTLQVAAALLSDAPLGSPAAGLMAAAPRISALITYDPFRSAAAGVEFSLIAIGAS